ncbi:acyl carrier protein [Kibdelosporangium banguiense]|uniref:Acyl carrier protein n=1 Tax=Kibdelosporangium banguiense TaxID=1365924 RepID=A0ABS4TUC1_9PSEU|nr:acyl carrier protein [Kibdelosporangium banguiense]MBP2327563.1 acyl carrier protein [Kibdelosporangium banguiense]
MSETTEILVGFARIIQDVTAGAVTQQDVTFEKSFADDLDLDSLAMVEVAVRAEETFGVRIPEDEVPNLKTVRDAVNYVSTNAA